MIDNTMKKLATAITNISKRTAGAGATAAYNAASSMSGGAGVVDMAAKGGKMTMGASGMIMSGLGKGLKSLFKSKDKVLVKYNDQSLKLLEILLGKDLL